MKIKAVLAVILLSCNIFAFSSEAKEFNLTVNNTPVSDANLVMKDGTTYLPLKKISEILGAKVTYQQGTSPFVRVLNETDDISLYLKSPYALTKEGGFKVKQLPLLQNGTTYLSLRSVSELFGYEVTFDKISGKIAVDTTKNLPKQGKLNFSFHQMLEDKALIKNNDGTFRLNLPVARKHVVENNYLLGDFTAFNEYYYFLKNNDKPRFEKESKVFILEAINEARKMYNVSPLKTSSLLEKGADLRARELKQKYSHTRPNNTKCFTVLDEMGIHFNQAGENIAIGYQTPLDVFNGWITSPGHRKNSLSRDFNTIGIGVYVEDGLHTKGSFAYHWVEMFTD